MGFIKYRSGPDAEWQEIYAIKGDDGYTPVKGVDYFTETDKNELIQEFQESIVDGEINLANYYTKTETDAAIAAVEPDLTGYYTSTETDAAIEEALDNYLTADDLAGYALKTDIPDTTGLATEEYVDEAVAAATGADLTNYYTKEEVDNAISNVDVDLSNYYTKSEISSTLGNYYTKTQTTNAIKAVYTYDETTGRLDINV